VLVSAGFNNLTNVGNVGSTAATGAIGTGGSAVGGAAARRAGQATYSGVTAIGKAVTTGRLGK